MIKQESTSGAGDRGVSGNVDRELGAITQRLTSIDRRLDEGDRDMQGLMKTTTELTIAVAGLTSKIADLTQYQSAARLHEGKMIDALERMVDRLAQPPAATAGTQMTPTSVASIAVPAAGGGGLLGAAVWAKIATLLGLGS